MKTRNHTKDYRLEVPEGGWGYVICMGMVMSFICAFSSIPCFVLIYKEFLEGLGEGTSAVAVMTTCYFSAISFTGILSSNLFNRYSLRSVGLTGGLMYFAGAVIQVFVQSTTQLFAAFSLLQGTAIGLIIPTAYTCFKQYFAARRIFMLCIAQSLIGVGTIFYPVFIQKLLEQYGFRGCLAILAAISGHVVLGMLVMHPVKWHMRKVAISKQELKIKKLEQFEFLVDRTDNVLDSKKPWITTPTFSLTSNNICSMGNWTGPLILSEAFHYEKNTNIKWPYQVDYFDLQLLQDSTYMNIVFGISFALYADIAFSTLHPLYLFELGFSKLEIANILALSAAADLFSRFLLAASNVLSIFHSRYVFLYGVLFLIVARTAFLAVFDFRGIAIMTIIIGFFKTWLHVPLPLVFAEYLPKERFPSGYGLFMFLLGNIMFVVGPIVGYIRDVTRSYEVSFHCLDLFLAACAFPWLIEILFVKCRNRRRRRCELEAGLPEI